MLNFNMIISNPFTYGSFGEDVYFKDIRITKNSSFEFQLNNFSWDLTTGVSFSIDSFKTDHRGFDFSIYFLGSLFRFGVYDHRHFD